MDERGVRAAIRKHVKNSIGDFPLLLEQMEERDRRQIFQPPEADSNWDFAKGTTLAMDRPLDHGLVDTIGFAILAGLDAGLDPEQLIRNGVNRAFRQEQFPKRVIDVSIDMKEEMGLVESGIEAMEAREPLTDEQKIALLESDEIPAEELAAYVRGSGPVWESSRDGD